MEGETKTNIKAVMYIYSRCEIKQQTHTHVWTSYRFLFTYHVGSVSLQRVFSPFQFMDVQTSKSFYVPKVNPPFVGIPVCQNCSAAADSFKYHTLFSPFMLALGYMQEVNTKIFLFTSSTHAFLSSFFFNFTEL